MFSSEVYILKLNLQPKIGLTYATSIVKGFFLIFCLRKYFILFYAEFGLLMFHNNIVKNSKKLNKQNVENQPPSHLPYSFLHNVPSFFLWEKVKIFDFLKIND